MNQTKNIMLIITIAIVLGVSLFLYKKFSSNKTNITQPKEQIFTDDNVFDSEEFSDGLMNPDSVITYPLQEFETGISEKYVYAIDINKDGKPDRITKTFFENGNAHSYYKYSIELNNGKKYIDITPKGLQTTNGADCDLQQIQFKFKPQFQIVVISREMGDTWDEPTMANKTTYSLKNDVLNESSKTPLRKICDVKELF
jgi:hypothetical protein